MIKFYFFQTFRFFLIRQGEDAGQWYTAATGACKIYKVLLLQKTLQVSMRGYTGIQVFCFASISQCFWVGHQNGTKIRKIWVSYNFLIRTQKKFQAKIRTFLKILFWIFWKKLKTFSIFFSPKEILDQDLSFGFCFIKIGRLESTF